MKKIILSSIFISAFILLGSFYQASALANPASVKCNLDGGVSVTQKDANGGEYSNCKFPDGSVCEEWAYYRGECSPKKPLTLDQLSTSCTSAFDGCNTCSRASGGQWACTMMACMGEQKSATCKNTASDTDTKKPAICTKEYAPVCGQPKMPECKDGMMCAQVMPTQKTYSNKCMMQADGASLVSDGACENKTELNTKKYKPSFCTEPFPNENFSTLRKGSKGSHVVELQRSLNSLGFGPISIDGKYGPQLTRAVKKLQNNSHFEMITNNTVFDEKTKKQFKIDGVFGNGTRGWLCGYFVQGTTPSN